MERKSRSGGENTVESESKWEGNDELETGKGRLQPFTEFPATPGLVCVRLFVYTFLFESVKRILIEHTTQKRWMDRLRLALSGSSSKKSTNNVVRGQFLLLNTLSALFVICFCGYKWDSFHPVWAI